MEILKDTIISFEAAKMAREIGMVKDVLAHFVYCIGYNDIKPDPEPISFTIITNVTSNLHLALAPTQALMCKWLRLNKNIEIDIKPLKGLDKYSAQVLDTSTKIRLTSKISGYIYEKVLETAIVRALNYAKTYRTVKSIP